ncbi:hypothetical protein VPH526E571_0021 [Vibrio phage 526E57-1]
MLVRLIAYRGFGKCSVFMYCENHGHAMSELYKEYPDGNYTGQRVVVITS